MARIQKEEQERNVQTIEKELNEKTKRLEEIVNSKKEAEEKIKKYDIKINNLTRRT